MIIIMIIREVCFTIGGWMKALERCLEISVKKVRPNLPLTYVRIMIDGGWLLVVERRSPIPVSRSISLMYMFRHI